MKKVTYCSYYCKAWCCKHIIVEFNIILDTDTRKFLALRNISIDEDNNKIIIPNRCNWLNSHNKCRFYEQRPIDCKVYECKTLKTDFKSS